MIPTVGLHKFLDALKRREPHCRAHFCHLAVRPYVDDVVIAAESEVAHQPHLFGQNVVVGQHSATFERVEEFRGMKAEDLATPEATDRIAFVGASKRMSRIEHKLQISAARNRFQSFNITRASPRMKPEYADGSWRNHLFD